MIIVIGGGPAGYFGAISAKSLNPDREVLLLEQGSEVLRKVRVSGGGRCNLTHDCDSPGSLAANYPRGGKALLGPFHSWGPAETRQWFEDRGVPLKTETDGRVFPVSDSAASIVTCLEDAARGVGVEIRSGLKVVSLGKLPAGLSAGLANGTTLEAEKILLAAGGSGSHHLAAELGHTIIEPVPSLFTFNINDPLLEGLAGVACPRVNIRAAGPGIPQKGLEQSGPLLITHWGVSGPAVLKLSAWGARLLHDCAYHFTLRVDWCPDFGFNELSEILNEWGQANGQKLAGSSCPVQLPRRLWTALVHRSGIPAERRWAELGRKMLTRLAENLKGTTLNVQGKSTFKEEFVTCGGIKLSEVDFKTMSSRVCPDLFFAGEILDIDGITGGFNFQACWTTGHLAGKAMAG